MNLDKLQNPDAEQSLLAVCMLNKNNDNSAFVEIGGYLQSNDFYGIANQTVYEAISQVFADGNTLAMPSVVDYIERHGKMDNIGSPMYVAQICEVMAYPSQLKLYAKQIKECSNRRKLIVMAHDIESKMQDKTIDVEEAMGKLIDDVEAMRVVEEENNDNSLEEAFDSLISVEEDGISYGFPSLDYYLKGMKKGHFLVLAGRPAMGKTALALNIVRNACRQGNKVIFFSLEMTKKDLYKRLLTCEAGISEAEAKRYVQKAQAYGESPETQKFYESLEAGKRRVSNWNLDIVENAFTLGDIRAKAKLIAKKKGVDLIVIDHLQLMSIAGYKENRTAEMTEITRQIVSLAKQVQTPILCLSQVNRGNEARTDKRPLSSDLKESGSIEQDADAIMVIYRDRYYNPDGDDWTEVIVRKNRHGDQGTAKLSFDMGKCRFTEYRGIAGESVKGAKKEEVKEVLRHDKK